MSCRVIVRIGTTLVVALGGQALDVHAVPVKLSGSLVGGGDVSPVVKISPDGGRIAFFADRDTDDVVELYSHATSGGGSAVKLNGPLISGGDVVNSDLAFSPNGDRVLYLADQNTNEVRELYVVSSSGGTPTKLNGSLVAGGDVDFASLQFNADGSRVLYTADQQTNDRLEIFSVPSTGGTSVKMNATLAPGGSIDASSAQFSADGSQVTYLAAQGVLLA